VIGQKLNKELFQDNTIKAKRFNNILFAEPNYISKHLLTSGQRENRPNQNRFLLNFQKQLCINKKKILYCHIIDIFTTDNPQVFWE